MELKPCPICGGPAHEDDYLKSVGMVACGGDCAIELPYESWQCFGAYAAIVEAAKAWHQAIEDLNGVQAAEDKLRALLRDI